MVAGPGAATIDPALPSALSLAIVRTTTCAGLMATPDKPLPAGYRVVPEIAADYPRITNGGRTYTFRCDGTSVSAPASA